MNLRFFGLIMISLFALTSPGFAQPNSWENAPIDYLTAEVDDPVARLAKAIESGEKELEYDEQFGYLKAVLKKLDVPESSQTLVFSKTSLQLHRITPRRPRSLYFNDDVYVGYCQRGDVLELAATDAKQGATFYTLSQEKAEKPSFVRDKGNCLTCHASSRTQSVPGYLVRSVYPDRAGRPKLGSGTFTTDHTSDFKERWGGWYVSGSHGEMRHMGNTICDGTEFDFDYDTGANNQDLTEKLRYGKYLTSHSDIVALMVLEHQSQMHNAIAFANYETRMALHQSYQMNEILERPEGFISDVSKRRISKAADRVLQHLLFCDEFQLTDAVVGTTDFAKDFSAKGRRDSAGRSLRDFDLRTRMFRYPCSYLIYSNAFAGLPDEVRSIILKRLSDILEGQNDSEDYNHLTPAIRSEILAILRATLPELREISVTTSSAVE